MRDRPRPMLVPTQSSSAKTGFAAAVIWLILLLPDLSARYSFGWDSAQFARGVEHYDIAAHQPHPPGYPLWVLGARLLTPVAGNPYRAQIALGMAFSIAGLLLFRAMARKLLGGDEQLALGATMLLGFSPLICLYANSSQVYAVDLFASCLGGWLAAELWQPGVRRGRVLAGFAAIALTAGFRPSGATFLLPLLGIALLRTRDIKLIAQAVMVTAACWLAWLTPTAMTVGGFRAMSQMNNLQATLSFAKTSVLFGAPPIVHAHMIAEACIYFAIALSGFAIPVAMGFASRSPARVCQTPWWFFALWMGPNLAVLFLLHCSQPGYIMLTVPPTALLLVRLVGAASLRTYAAGVAFALVVTYLPYERLMHPAQNTLAFLFLRSTPRISRIVEGTQREIREQIDHNVPTRADGKKRKILCRFQRFEAPNIRTLTYDFADIDWMDLESQPAETRPDAWLCDGGGLPPAVRAAFPKARRAAGNRFYSLWLPGDEIVIRTPQPR